MLNDFPVAAVGRVFHFSANKQRHLENFPIFVMQFFLFAIASASASVSTSPSASVFMLCAHCCIQCSVCFSYLHDEMKNQRVSRDTNQAIPPVHKSGAGAAARLQDTFK